MKHWSKLNEKERKLYREKYKNSIYNNHLKRNYGITFEDYNSMFNEQKGCCAICGTHQSELKQKLCVDHNHETGEIRKLLCKKCNWVIGLVDENPQTLKIMIKYLQNF